MATVVADMWTNVSVSRNKITILSLHLRGTDICALAYTKYSLWVTHSKDMGEKGGVGTTIWSSSLINSLLEDKPIEVFGGIQPIEFMHILKAWQNTHTHTQKEIWQEIATSFLKSKWKDSYFSKLIKVEALIFKMNSNRKWIYYNA